RDPQSTGQPIQLNIGTRIIPASMTGSVTETDLAWLNSAAPRWEELIAGAGDSFQVYPPQGQPEQPERFGTSWAADIIRKATSETPEIERITALSLDGFTTRQHTEHHAGMSIDVGIGDLPGTWQKIKPTAVSVFLTSAG